MHLVAMAFVLEITLKSGSMPINPLLGWMQEDPLNKYKLFGLVFVLGTVFDQVTKLWVVYNIRGPREAVKGISLLDKFGLDMETWRSLPDKIEVIPGFFWLVHTQNAGAAFGIMQGKMLVFALFTVIALVVIVWTLIQMPDDDRFQNVALSLLASGTVGNGIDRMHKQSVTDFLHVYSEHPSVKPILVDILGSSAWPSFNIADAAIVIGMIMFAIFYVFLEKDEESEPDPPSEALSDITGDGDLGGEPSS